MEDLQQLNLSDLLDLLIEQTTHHTNLISLGATPEQFRISNEILRQLQKEIELRRSAKSSSQPVASSKDQSSLEISN
jgi:hypothetical protein